jgi:hypothetical protein
MDVRQLRKQHLISFFLLLLIVLLLRLEEVIIGRGILLHEPQRVPLSLHDLDYVLFVLLGYWNPA